MQGTCRSETHLRSVWRRDFSRLSSTNRILASIVTADPVTRTVCGIPTSAYAGRRAPTSTKIAKNCRTSVEMIEKYSRRTSRHRWTCRDQRYAAQEEQEKGRKGIQSTQALPHLQMRAERMYKIGQRISVWAKWPILPWHKSGEALLACRLVYPR
jgi:hypothetical protein